VKWLFLPSIGRSGGTIIIFEFYIFELVDSRTGVYSICSILRSM